MAITRTQLPTSLQTFGDISRLLREGVADEDSRQFRDALTALSGLVEKALQTRRAPGAHPDAVLQCAGQLLEEAREHQRFLTGLGSAWHALYEFAAYENAMRQLVRTTLAWQQALQRRSRNEAQCFQAFESHAWRALGEAVLVIDMYEQGGMGTSELQGLLGGSEPPPGRRRGWWGRLGGWLARGRAGR
ncbi:hypothetical protein [Paracidovorax konjaci]|uniref:Uncharacterized protein n=1 Tax=Paracidovorax konjaci TaxID=32040 RepID=A0A1I1VRT2_9BURK|nr:hypothetical protein [Paracidovorax konjaci]SFD85534.1 hypothetical protein SAMN04489710_107105 [Paracidovorax konjaci]